MKLLHKVVELIILVLVVAVGLLVLKSALSSNGWDALVGLVHENRLPGGCLAVSLLCLAAVSMLSGLSRKKRRSFLTFDQEGGTVSMSTEAIADYISKLAGEFPSIIRMVPKVVPGKKTIDIVIDVRIKSEPPIHDVCELLRQRVRESVMTGLGISEVRHIEVSVREIVSEQTSR